MSQSLLADASQRLERALKAILISDDAIERLKYPKASLSVSIPVRMDNGSLRIFPGYRVRYDDTRGPGKGGVRYHPNVSLDEVQSLAFVFFPLNDEFDWLDLVGNAHPTVRECLL